MPSDRTWRKLVDIRHNILLARSWLEGHTLETFSADQRTVYAVLRALEVISEATRAIDTEVKARYPHIPWADIAGAGNIYRHNYDDVTEARIWQTATVAVVPLLAVVEAELAARHSRP